MTKYQFFIYGDSKLRLKGYADASFQSNVDDVKFVFGCVITLNGGAKSWKSSKQANSVDSTIEA